MLQMLGNPENDRVAESRIWNFLAHVAGILANLQGATAIRRAAHVDRDRELPIVLDIGVPIERPLALDHSVEPAFETSERTASGDLLKQTEQFRIIEHHIEDIDQGVIPECKILPHVPFCFFPPGAAQVTLNYPEEPRFDEARESQVVMLLEMLAGGPHLCGRRVG